MGPEGRAGLDGEVVFAEGQVVDPLDAILGVFLHGVGPELGDLDGAVLPQRANDALAGVDMRDQVEHHLPAVANPPAQIIEEVEGRYVGLPLQCAYRLSAPSIRDIIDGCLMEPHDRLHVVGGVECFLQGPGRDAGEGLALGRFLAAIGHEGPILGVGGFPLAGIRAGKRRLRADVGRLGCHADEFGGVGAPVVEHPLGVLGVTDEGAKMALAVDVDLFAIDRDDRDVAPRPLGRLQHLGAGQQMVDDLVALDLALGLDGYLQRLEGVPVGLIDLGADHVAVRQHKDRARVLGADPVFRDHDVLAVEPGLIEIGIGPVFPIDRLGALVAALEFVLRQHLDQERRVPVRAVGGFRVGVAEDVERVRDALDEDVLLERIVLGKVHVDAEVAEAHGHGEVGRGVVGHIGVGGLLDVADKAVDDGGRRHVGAAVHRPHLDLRLVRARIVGHLADVRRQLGDGQRRTPLRLALL